MTLAADAMRRSIAASNELLGEDELRVLSWFQARLVLGVERYGKLDLARDQRDFGVEEREEHLDALVYRACAELIRMDRVHADLRAAAGRELLKQGLAELRDAEPVQDERRTALEIAFESAAEDLAPRLRGER